MYDIVLHIDFEKTPQKIGDLRSWYSYLSFYNDNSSQRKEIERPCFTAVGYSREADEWDVVQSDGTIVMLIGEAYLSRWGSDLLGQRSHRLRCSEVFAVLSTYPDACDKILKGNYVLLQINTPQQYATIRNNRFGISPFYFTAAGSSLYASTSLKALQNVYSGQREFDPVAILQKEIFSYPLGKRTLLRNISALEPAEVVSFSKGTIRTNCYWSPDALYAKKLLSEEDALAVGADRFSDAVNLRVQDVPAVNLSLTGGFDGRTMLSVLQKKPEDIRLYSFGIEGSENITIPRQICSDLGYRFSPIVLDGNYENVYPHYAREMVLQSDCLRTIEGANYPYTFNLLKEYSSVVLTGIFGSELLRTFQNVGFMVTQDFVDLNNTGNADDQWVKIKQRLLNESYVSREIIETHFDEVREDFTENSWVPIAQVPRDKRFYLFLMKEGLRKYFGGEVHSERIYATNRFPYLDDDFVEFIFQSPFAGIYSTALHPTIHQRFRSQYFYAKIMEKFRPELLKYQTDHGFPADSILSRVPLLKISVPLILHRQRRKKTGYREFKPVEWSELFISTTDLSISMVSPFVNSRLQNHLMNGTWKTNFGKFASFMSLNLWWNN